MEVQSDVGVTRGPVDNENNNQSQDSNILNNIHDGSLIYGVREQSISQGYGKCKRKHSKEMYTWLREQECRDGQEQEARLILNRKQGWDLITSRFECRMEVPGISEVMWK